VAVRKHCGRIVARATPLANDYGMSGRLMYGRLEPGVAHVSRDPFRRACRVCVMLGASADTRYSKQLEELVVNACVVLREVLVEIGGYRGFSGGSRHE
jgi:hypothetical protein